MLRWFGKILPRSRGMIALSLLYAMTLGVSLFPPAPAYAACGLKCEGDVEDALKDQWGDNNPSVPQVNNDAPTFPRIETHLETEYNAMVSWLVSIWWEDNIAPAMMMMANEFSAMAMKQTEIIGAFIDAKHQLETQQLIQRIAARTHKDYHPSIGMCEFGSTTRSLAASERKSELGELIMSRRSQDRQLGNMNTAAAAGPAQDLQSRLKQFREKYCDPRDNGNGLAYMCDWDQTAPPGPQIGAADPARMNKDIDYVRTVDFPWTLKMDLTNTTLQNEPDEEDVMALASNLYGHELFPRLAAGDLQAQNGKGINLSQKLYLDARSLIAKRSVAENSFNAITAMKAAGTPGAHDYLMAIMKQFLPPLPPGSNPGPNDPYTKAVADFQKMLGDSPSYYAQMEVLTKKMYENPDFYTNLYDTPANVARKGVAIQAIGLMQKFDLYKSYLRNEASLSVLLELAVDDLQEEVENEANRVKDEGTPVPP